MFYNRNNIGYINNSFVAKGQTLKGIKETMANLLAAGAMMALDEGDFSFIDGKYKEACSQILRGCVPNHMKLSIMTLSEFKENMKLSAFALKWAQFNAGPGVMSENSLEVIEKLVGVHTYTTITTLAPHSYSQMESEAITIVRDLDHLGADMYYLKVVEEIALGRILMEVESFIPSDEVGIQILTDIIGSGTRDLIKRLVAKQLKEFEGTVLADIFAEPDWMENHKEIAETILGQTLLGFAKAITEQQPA